MKRKLCVIFLIMAILISALIIDVSALSFATTLTPSSQQVAPGSEVLITIAVSSLNVGNSGINEFVGTFYYDTNVFEAITDSNMEVQNGWSPTYSTGTNTITLKKNSFVNKAEDVLQITLKVKQNVAEDTTGTVSLSKVSVSNSEDNPIPGSDISTTITVGKGTAIALNEENENGGSIQLKLNNTNTQNMNNNSNNTENKNNSNIIPLNNNQNTPSKDIPYAGTEGSAMIKIILGVVLVALFMYIKIEKMNELK